MDSNTDYLIWINVQVLVDNATGKAICSGEYLSLLGW